MLAALAAAAAWMLAAPGIAGAQKAKSSAKTITRVGSTSISGFASLGTAKARCPKGTVAIGGGYDSAGLLFVYESRRVKNHTWQVSAGQSGAGPTKLTAYAYCRKGVVRQAIETVSLPGSARAEQRAVADCPRGQKALSGGFHLPAQVDRIVTFAVESKLASSSSWSVKGVRSAAAAGGDNDVTAFVYCAKTKGKGELREKTSSAVTAATPVPVEAATDPCTSPRRALGGGFETTFTDRGADRGAIFVTESRATGNGWQVSGSATGGATGIGLPVSLNSFAFCR